MKKIISLIVFIFVTSYAWGIGSNTSNANELHGLARNLLNWLDTNTTYNGKVPLPNIIVLPRDEILKEWCSKFWRKCPSDTVIAFYRHRTDTLFILEYEKTISKEYYEIIILHELVHYLQDLDGQMYWKTFCLNKIETEAYKTEIKYIQSSNSNNAIRLIKGIERGIEEYNKPCT